VKRVSLKRIPLEPTPFTGWAPKVHRALFALFIIEWGLVWARQWLPHPPFGEARWPEGLLVVLAVATLLASLTTQLPGQNVMLTSLIISFLGGGVELLGSHTGIPFGPFSYTEAIGPQLLPGLPWAVPMIWIAALVVSRGVARLVLRPWRHTPNYGFWLLGVTALLVVLLDLGLEPFASQVAQLWRWAPLRVRLEWYTAPFVNFLGWGVTALLILAFITPALINKRPMKQPPPDYHPLAVWLLLNLLFATGAAVHNLWPAVGFISGVSVVVAIAGMRAAGITKDAS
jgi:putative membrane protein